MYSAKVTQIWRGDWEPGIQEGLQLSCDKGSCLRISHLLAQGILARGGAVQNPFAKVFNFPSLWCLIAARPSGQQRTTVGNHGYGV
ncbi:MAG: hypothetical protein H6879_08110 [Rhodobiaceae bacterium]|nr:hypothetical protein [Rhodobiaceae bacterium]